MHAVQYRDCLNYYVIITTDKLDDAGWWNDRKNRVSIGDPKPAVLLLANKTKPNEEGHLYLPN